MADLVASLTSHSHAMAELLTGLTRHFDLCVTAVRITEGGSAALLARRKADGVYDEHHHADPGSSVSISGVMAEQDNAAAYSTNSDGQHLVPETAADRAEMLAVVEQDAGEVDDVVQELSERGAAVARQHAQVLALRDAAVLAHTAARTAFTILEDVSVRVPGYAAAETEYAERWAVERVTIADRLAEMDALRVFYEGYASAYDNLVLEVDRRRAAEDKIRALWRKAKEAVDRVMEADARERAIFKAEVGQYLPTDLWPGMTAPIKRWDVVPAATTRPGERGSDTLTLAQSTPLLSRSVVESARERLEAARQGIR